MKKLSKLQIARHIIQLIAFIFFPGLFYLAFQALRNPSGSNILIILAIFPVTIIAGRFFCGFLCSFGAMEDLISFISSKVLKKKFVIKPSIHKYLKYLKFIVLALIVLFWVFAINVDSKWNPWYIFGLRSLGSFASVGGILLIIIIILSFFFERFFCRYLCPLGAIFALLSPLRLVSVCKKEEKCVGCGKCSRSCPMGLDVYEKDCVQSGECIQCMKCLSACPFEALEMPVDAAKACAVAVGTMMAVSYVGEVVPLSTPAVQSVEMTIPVEIETVVEEEGFEDGVYTGTGTGFRGQISVEVTVKDGKISDIAIVSSREDRQFMNRAKDTVIGNIINSQSNEVDAVSGATYSSYGIIEAVSNALGLDYTKPATNMRKYH